MDNPWILTPPGAAIFNYMMQVFHERGLGPPFIAFGTQSAGLRGDLLATGDYIAPIPRSIFNLYAKQFALKMLLVDLPVRPWPIALVTLKNRTMSPVVERFIECARSTTKSFIKGGKRANS
jgi:DNA-binding transcriptional LysR family regulator